MILKRFVMGCVTKCSLSFPVFFGKTPPTHFTMCISSTVSGAAMASLVLSEGDTSLQLLLLIVQKKKERAMSELNVTRGDGDPRTCFSRSLSCFSLLRKA